MAHLVLDFNGTLAVDGRLAPGVAARLEALSADLQVHVVTADTFGTVQGVLAGLPVTVTVLGQEAQDRAKQAYVERLGASSVVAMGNGRNDRLMLHAAALGVCVLLAEGASAASLAAADVAASGIADALDILLFPKRLIATLRS